MVAETNEPPPALPPHIAETISLIAGLHAEHHKSASLLERAVDRVTAILARPRFVAFSTIAVLGWIALNLSARTLGLRPADPPPFTGLIGVVSVASFYMVVFILATQRREDRLAQLREQVTLELVLLSEQKLAKVIQLLEESRRDNPLIPDRVDGEADAMAQPADAQSVIHKIREIHAEAEQFGGGDETDGNPPSGVSRIVRPQ